MYGASFAKLDNSEEENRADDATNVNGNDDSFNADVAVAEIVNEMEDFAPHTADNATVLDKVKEDHDRLIVQSVNHPDPLNNMVDSLLSTNKLEIGEQNEREGIGYEIN